MIDIERLIQDAHDPDYWHQSSDAQAEVAQLARLGAAVRNALEDRELESRHEQPSSQRTQLILQRFPHEQCHLGKPPIYRAWTNLRHAGKGGENLIEVIRLACKQEDLS